MNISLPKIIYKFIGIYHILKDAPAYRSFSNYQKICRLCGENIKFESKNKIIRALDLGCGSVLKNPFKADYIFGVDLSPNSKNIKYANLAIDKIPFSSSKFNFVTAYDFIEHIPRIIYINGKRGRNFSSSNEQYRFAFVELMNEIYRVLKVGGYFLSVTPAYPFSIAFTDPTHVNYINEHTYVNYFTKQRIAKIYGFTGDFDLIKQGFQGKYLVTLLRKR